jgi:hypothetical protein
MKRLLLKALMLFEHFPWHGFCACENSQKLPNELATREGHQNAIVAYPRDAPLFGVPSSD